MHGNEYKPTNKEQPMLHQGCPNKGMTVGGGLPFVDMKRGGTAKDPQIAIRAWEQMYPGCLLCARRSGSHSRVWPVLRRLLGPFSIRPMPCHSYFSLSMPPISTLSLLSSISSFFIVSKIVHFSPLLLGCSTRTLIHTRTNTQDQPLPRSLPSLLLFHAAPQTPDSLRTFSKISNLALSPWLFSATCCSLFPCSFGPVSFDFLTALFLIAPPHSTPLNG